MDSQKSIRRSEMWDRFSDHCDGWLVVELAQQNPGSLVRLCIWSRDEGREKLDVFISAEAWFGERIAS